MNCYLNLAHDQKWNLHINLEILIYLNNFAKEISWVCIESDILYARGSVWLNVRIESNERLRRSSR